jgi:hypothetical protein
VLLWRKNNSRVEPSESIITGLPNSLQKPEVCVIKRAKGLSILSEEDTAAA